MPLHTVSLLPPTTRQSNLYFKFLLQNGASESDMDRSVIAPCGLQIVDVEDSLKSLIRSVGGEVTYQQGNKLQSVNSTWCKQRLTNVLDAT